MEERVPIAHFADPQTASLAADFLEHQGIDAVFLDKTGRGGGGGVVLTPKRQATNAAALLHRVRKGEFAEAGPGQTPEDAQAQIDLTQALQPQTTAAPWINHLPVIVVAGVVILSIAGLMIAAALSDL